MTEYVWERNEQVVQCRSCERWFNFFTRRHHCRRCGQVICDHCSLNRALLSCQDIIPPPHIRDKRKISSQPQRICDSCVERLVLKNSILHYSFMLECPVCNQQLFELEYEQEQHVHNCLQQNSIIQRFESIGTYIIEWVRGLIL